MMTKSYSELMSIDSFDDRLKYLMTKNSVGDATFGGHRQLNQILYKTREWQSTRDEIIIRDAGYDLAHPDYLIGGSIYIHHINPITIEDILERRPCVFDPENLISASYQTHNTIHYGVFDLKIPPVTNSRSKNDTAPWRT